MFHIYSWFTHSKLICSISIVDLPILDGKNLPKKHLEDEDPWRYHSAAHHEKNMSFSLSQISMVILLFLYVFIMVGRKVMFDLSWSSAEEENGTPNHHGSLKKHLGRGIFPGYFDPLVSSGKLRVCYWKWPFIVDLPQINVIFHSYVSLPKGIPHVKTMWIFVRVKIWGRVVILRLPSAALLTEDLMTDVAISKARVADWRWESHGISWISFIHVMYPSRDWTSPCYIYIYI